jgi:hypothetical protein
MEVLIKSPKITRGKGIRSVRGETNQKGSINDRDAAYNKLFDHYLSDQQPNKTLVRKLKKHDYFANLLRNKKELQHMKMELLSKVLLFFDSKDDDNLFGNNLKAEILTYLHIPTSKKTKSLKKKVNNIDDNNIDDNKEILDFFRYARFIQILIDNNKINNEKDQEKIWDKSGNMEMIHPHSAEY